MHLYRYITGPDDSSFCQRISALLNKGWILYGNPTLTFDPTQSRVICGQAVMKEVDGEYTSDIKLSDY